MPALSSSPAGSVPDWSRGLGSPALKLGLCTFGILALELAIIRWMSGQIRVVAYFQNLVLLAAFFGMGLGVALGRRYSALIHACLPVVAVLAAVLGFSEQLNLVHLRFPDPSISLWGGDAKLGLLPFLGATVLVTGFFWFVASVFLLAGVPVGWLFHQMPPLTAYSVDILGSLLGVLAMTAAAAVGTSPPVWLALGTIPFVLLTRRWYAVLAAVVVCALAYVSVQGATFSPYNRIDVEPFGEGRADEWRLKVNRDFHQDMLNLSDEALAEAPRPDPMLRRNIRRVYELPFHVHGKGGRALIVGAGTGNDVMAALRTGYEEVYSVEIDGEILDYGARLHPEQPYSDPRVKPIVNDARAYFEQHPNERFDVVCYGLLDSHSMFSAMSSLRLDNYVYTVEGIRAGWKRVKDDGILSISFSVFAGQWMVQRIIGIIRQATGQNPVLVVHGMHFGVTFMVGRKLDERRLPMDLGEVYRGGNIDPSIEIPTDDWPFLYLRPGAVPYAYLSVLFLLLLTCGVAVRVVYGRDLFSSNRFDVPLFLLGAGFMLLETRMVTALSLLFGSTWIVNASVFSGILIVILLANLLVAWRTPDRVVLWFVPLIVSLTITWAVSPSALNQFDVISRGILGGLLLAIPVGFAAVVFATLLKRAKDPSGALGSNLIGAMVGGIAEYSSMALGLRAMALLALLLYLGAMLILSRVR